MVDPSKPRGHGWSRARGEWIDLDHGNVRAFLRWHFAGADPIDVRCVSPGVESHLDRSMTLASVTQIVICGTRMAINSLSSGLMASKFDVQSNVVRRYNMAK